MKLPDLTALFLKLFPSTTQNKENVLDHNLTFRLLVSYMCGAPILDVSGSHAAARRGRWDSSGRVVGSSRGPLPDNARRSQQTGVRAPGGIRARDLGGERPCRSPAGIVGSSPTGGMDVCLL